ncbi:HIT family protein [Candidatus Woesearchaeota archaeon]|nr:HIT family protein [Candidatus Woesearchaeota archaeon]
MSDCLYCEYMNTANVLYADEIAVAVLNPKPAVPGHIIVIPKKHYTILEDVPENELEHLFTVANKLGSLVFEVLGANGTNIVVNNGVEASQEVPHFAIHVIPRKEGDGLDFRWKAEQAKPDDLEETELFLKDGLSGKEPVEKEEETADEVEKIEGGKDNYLIKQLERIP